MKDLTDGERKWGNECIFALEFWRWMEGWWLNICAKR